MEPPLSFVENSLDPRPLIESTGASVEPTAQQIARALRSGGCPKDRVFDRFLPDELRLVSWQYWTPLIVAKRASQWFAAHGVRTVVDIGSGAGKFCVAAALAGGCRYVGIEQRPRLVVAARELARLFDVDARVSFVEGAFGEIPTLPADAYYLFNPFGENIFDAESHLDEDVELSDARYERDTLAVTELLQSAPRGTYLLTYNGFGGEVPRTYEQVRVDRDLPNVLRMWRQTC